MGYWSLLCFAVASMNFACGLPLLGILMATLGLILGVVDLVNDGPEDDTDDFEDEAEEIDRRKVNKNILAALKAAK